QVLAVEDADALGHGHVLAVHEDVEVLVNVDHRALGAELAEAERLEAVGQVVEPGVPRRWAGLDADQIGGVGRRRRRGRGVAVVAGELEGEENGDESDDPGGRERGRYPERPPLFGRALPARPDAALGRLNL